MTKPPKEKSSPKLLEEDYFFNTPTESNKKRKREEQFLSSATSDRSNMRGNNRSIQDTISRTETLIEDAYSSLEEARNSLEGNIYIYIYIILLITIRFDVCSIIFRERSFTAAILPENDVVLDTFAGVSSTFLACQNTSRKCIYIELMENYVDIFNTHIFNTYYCHTYITAKLLPYIYL